MWLTVYVFQFRTLLCCLLATRPDCSASTPAIAHANARLHATGAVRSSQQSKRGGAVLSAPFTSVNFSPADFDWPSFNNSSFTRSKTKSVGPTSVRNESVLLSSSIREPASSYHGSFQQLFVSYNPSPATSKYYFKVFCMH